MQLLVVLLQVLGDWVAKRDLDEVLRVMGEARVPSGTMCDCIGVLCLRMHKPWCPCTLPTKTMHCDVGRLAQSSSLQDPLLMPKHLDSPCTFAGPILSTADLLKEEQFQARRMFEQAAPPSSAGPAITVPAMVPVLSRTPGEPPRLASLCGLSMGAERCTLSFAAADHKAQSAPLLCLDMHEASCHQFPTLALHFSGALWLPCMPSS